MRQIKAIMLIGIMILLSANSAFAENGRVIYYDGKSEIITHDDISIYVDDAQVSYEGMYPVVIEGRTLVPVRSVLEHPSIGAEVTWVGEENKIIIKHLDTEVLLYLGSTVAYVNGEEVTLDRAPVLISTGKDNSSASTMVPIRFITEAIGYEVQWDQANYRIDLTSGTLPVIMPEETDDGSSGENSEDKPSVDGTTTSQDADSDDVMASNVIKREDTYEFEAYEDDFDYDETVMSVVKYNKYQDLYSIRTKDTMSSIKYFIWEGKLVVDISNVAIGDIKKDVDVETNDYVRSVRSSQFSYDPMAVRVVFDLIDGAQPTGVTINEDRTRIDVLFGNNGLDEITSAKTSTTDYLDIDGQYSDINIFRLSDPYRIVVDLENTINPFGNYKNDDYDGNYVKALRIAQFNETTTRIVFETEDYAQYNVSKMETGDTRITIGDASVVAEDDPDKTQPTDGGSSSGGASQSDAEPSIGGATVESHMNELDTLLTINGSAIETLEYSVEYDYINKSATISFGSADMSGATTNVKDGSVVTSQKLSSGKLTIKTNHIYDLAVVLEEGRLFVKGARPSELYDKIVVIDPGHGGSDPGAVVSNYHEKDINLRVTEYFRTKMNKSGDVRYIFTREKDIYPTLEDRVEIANDVKADLFISVHSNALDLKLGAYLATINGFEVHITDQFEQSSEEKALADRILSYVSASDEIPVKAKSVKVYNELYVLKNTLMPSILIEMGYMTNEGDLGFLTDEEKSVKMANVLNEGINLFFENR